MARSRRSARAAGTRFESLLAAYWAETVDDRVERRAKNGSKDRGDISGLRSVTGHRIVVECKDAARTDLSGWRREAVVEALNDGAEIPVVAHKRVGKGQPGEQWVTMTAREFALLVGGNVPPLEV